MKIDSRAAASAAPNCHETRQTRENEPSPFSLSPHPGVPHRGQLAPAQGPESFQSAGSGSKFRSRPHSGDQHPETHPWSRQNGNPRAGVNSEGRDCSWEQSSHLLETQPRALAAQGKGPHPSHRPALPGGAIAYLLDQRFSFPMGFFGAMVRHPLAGPSTRSPPRRRGER